MRYDLRYDPVAYGATWSKAVTGLVFWVVLMVGLAIWGGIGPAPMVANSDPSPGFEAKPLDAVADRDRS
jgi:hypothetical protein